MTEFLKELLDLGVGALLKKRKVNKVLDEVEAMGSTAEAIKSAFRKIEAAATQTATETWVPPPLNREETLALEWVRRRLRRR